MQSIEISLISKLALVEWEENLQLHWLVTSLSCLKLIEALKWPKILGNCDFNDDDDDFDDEEEDEKEKCETFKLQVQIFCNNSAMQQHAVIFFQ
jgi:hypothetical protein